MKQSKMMLAFIGIGLAALTSCSADDRPVADQSEQSADHFLGKWAIVKKGQKIEVDGEIIMDQTNPGKDPGYDLQYTFNPDNTLNYYAHYPATDTQEEKTFEFIHEYERSGNYLMIKRGNDEWNYTILVLDQSHLHLEHIMEWDSEDTGTHYKVTTVDQFGKQ